MHPLTAGDRRRTEPTPGVGPPRLASLDGLRAVSILLVLLGHAGGTRGFTRLELGIGDYSHLGVVVFFVISGFLITGLLLKETATRGRVRLAHFYARRALRLFPAAYTYLGLVLALGLTGVFSLTTRDVWHAATYTVNYLPKPTWQVGHLWSLSVEEQFYLLWPFAFVALKPRRATWVVASVLLLSPLARLVAYVMVNRGLYTWWFETPYRSLFPLVADSLAAGCLLALLAPWLETQRWYLRLFRPTWSLGILVLVLLTNRYRSYSPIWVFGTSAINIGLAVLIHRSVQCSTDWVGRVLNLRPIAFIGTISYSLYLWQQLFLDRTSGAWVNAFPQNLGFAAVAALASYFLLERPLLALRHRLRA